MIPTNSDATPLIQQYFEIKRQYSDALLLFQVGDFYELFFEDAKQAASYLAIALTSRGKYRDEPIPLCGVPVHALDQYLIRLAKGGFRIAICDQLEEAVAGKMVRRGVTQVITPGTMTQQSLLDEKSSSYLLSFFPTERSWGLLFGELLTAQLFVTHIENPSDKVLETELARFFPSEIVLAQDKASKSFEAKFRSLGYFVSYAPPMIDDHEPVSSWLSQRVMAESRDLINGNSELYSALRAFYAYVNKNQAAALEQPWIVQSYQADDFLQLDLATQRNLELVAHRDGSRPHTLLSILDESVTPMGSRMIKKWLTRPLVRREAIEQRLDVVTLFIQSITKFLPLKDALRLCGDVERAVGRIAIGRAQLSDYCALSNALQQLPHILELLSLLPTMPVLLEVIVRHMQGLSDLAQLLANACNTDRHKQWLIAAGFNQQLDQLRDCVENSMQKFLDLEKIEQQKTGIHSLKVGFNQIHGYYFEVTKTNLALIPDYFVRLQTLVGKERFTTTSLQLLQHEIVRARTEVDELEKKLFEEVKQEVLRYLVPLRRLAHALATVDALGSFAWVAYHHGYVRPTFDDVHCVHIDQGRHPVVERMVGGSFIANDVQLDKESSLWIITGPNMGGKSTFLRQVALLSIMAHCGSLVPAQAMRLSIMDRIFTRIGAGDDLARGKSTFLVEMEETAVICNQATKKSLVILDEVGRGTSTVDGLAIAQAVIEYLYTQVGTLCLFATHYHELGTLEKKYSGIVGYHAASKQTKQGILFLYTMVRGVADGSFGIQVAKLAQLPDMIIERSSRLVRELTMIRPAVQDYFEVGKIDSKADENRVRLEKQGAFIDQIKAIDLDGLSPRQAFELLGRLQQRLRVDLLDDDSGA